MCMAPPSLIELCKNCIFLSLSAACSFVCLPGIVWFLYKAIHLMKFLFRDRLTVINNLSISAMLHCSKSSPILWGAWQMSLKRTCSPMVTTRCFSTSGLPRQNQHGPLGAGGFGGGAWGDWDWEERLIPAGLLGAGSNPLSVSDRQKTLLASSYIVDWCYMPLAWLHFQPRLVFP